MKYVHIVSVFLLGVLLLSCSDDEEEKEYRSVVATKVVQNITLTTAVVPAYASVGDVTLNTVDFEAGIQYTLEGDMDYENAQKKSVYVFQPNFSVSLSGLTPQTRYICRAYVFANGEYTYGQDVAFQTEKLQNVFSSIKLTNTKTNGATLQLKLEKNLLPTYQADLEMFSTGIAYTTHKPLLQPSIEALKNTSVCELFDGFSLPKVDVLEASMANLAADATYFYCTYVCCNGIYLCGPIQSLDTPSGRGMLHGHDWVDLGLESGTCWATMNVGASSEEEAGSYFAWGETSPKESYTCDNYSSFFEDVATAGWGEGWTLPSSDQSLELLNSCRWKYINQNGKEGYLVTGPNNNSIFLPSTGFVNGTSLSSIYSCYWTSTCADDSDENAYYIGFRNNSFALECDAKYVGQTVRPICLKQ